MEYPNVVLLQNQKARLAIQVGKLAQQALHLLFVVPATLLIRHASANCCEVLVRFGEFLVSFFYDEALLLNAAIQLQEVLG